MVIFTYRGRLYYYDHGRVTLTELATPIMITHFQRFGLGYVVIGLDGQVYVGKSWPDHLQELRVLPGLSDVISLTAHEDIWTVDNKSRVKRTTNGNFVNAHSCIIPFNKPIAELIKFDPSYLLLDNMGKVFSWSGQSVTEMKRIVFSRSRSTIVKLSVGAQHVLALASNGRVWSWGNDERGQLGQGRKLSDSHNQWYRKTSPIKISKLANITQILAHGNSSLALDSYGAVWTWGEGLHGELGLGNNKNVSSPRVVNLSGCLIDTIAMAVDGVVLSGQDRLFLIRYSTIRETPPEDNQPIELTSFLQDSSKQLIGLDLADQQVIIDLT